MGNTFALDHTAAAMRTMTGRIVSAAAGTVGKEDLIWIIIPAAILLASIILVVTLLVGKRNGKKGNADKEAVSVSRHTRAYFNKADYTGMNVVCLAYLSMEPSFLHRMYDADSAKKMIERVNGEIKTFCTPTDVFEKVGEASFVIGTVSPNGILATQRITKLTDTLNLAERDDPNKASNVFHTGICLGSVEENSFDILMNHASLAYGNACDNDKAVSVCTPELVKTEANKTQLRERFNKALDAKQFEMFLQFIYNQEKKKFTCAEVLSRWNDPVEGYLMPSYYLSDMRTTGVIKRFDMYMLDLTCAKLEEWNTGVFANLSLSCNMTRITISDPQFLAEFREILKKHEFDHSRLMIEITEDALIDRETALRNITSCRQDGVRVAIDDLCAGHSTLEDISDFPVDQVKLDRNVILASSTKRGKELIREVIAMAHRLNIGVVCEGVETDAQLSTVVSSGCDFVQGYYYSYVMPLGEAMEYYKKSGEKTEA